jgi:hypothetical protein
MGRRLQYKPRQPQQLPAFEPAHSDTFFTPQTIAIIVGVWLLILVVIVGAGYFVMHNRNFQSEFAPLVDVCQNRWVSAAAAYSPTPGTHPAVGMKQASGRWQPDPYLLPRNVVAGSLAETQIVVCLGRVQEIYIESCPYYRKDEPGVEKTLHRYYLKQEASVVEAKTGRVIAAQTFTGKSPHYCHETEYFREDRKTEKLVGTAISEAEVQRWYMAHLSIE